MYAEAHDVLEEDLVVGDAGTRLVLRKLQAQAAELRRRVVEHPAGAGWFIGAKLRKTGGRQTAVTDRPEVGSARRQPVVTQADTPQRHELIDPLQVPSRLGRRIGAGQRLSCRVERNCAAFPAT